MRELQNFLNGLVLNNISPGQLDELYSRYSALRVEEKNLLCRRIAPAVMEHIANKSIPVTRWEGVATVADQGDIAALRNGLAIVLTPHVSTYTGEALLMERFLQEVGAGTDTIASIINNPNAQAHAGLKKYTAQVRGQLHVQNDAALTALLTSNDPATQSRVSLAFAQQVRRIVGQAGLTNMTSNLSRDAFDQLKPEDRNRIFAQNKSRMFAYIGSPEYLEWQIWLEAACATQAKGAIAQAFSSVPNVDKYAWLKNYLLIEDNNPFFETKDIGVWVLLAAALWPPLAASLAIYLAVSCVANGVFATYKGIERGLSFSWSCLVGLVNIVEAVANVGLTVVEWSYRAVASLVVAIDAFILGDSITERVGNLWLWQDEGRTWTIAISNAYLAAKHTAINQASEALYQSSGIDIKPENLKELTVQEVAKQISADIKIDILPAPGAPQPQQTPSFVERIQNALGFGGGRGNP